jgi:hypothetical protein
MSRKTAVTLAGYGAAAALSMIAAVWLLELPRADLRVPFDYQGDTLFYSMVVKAIVEHGWYLRNPLLGAPGILELHDFPFADGFHHLVIKALAAFSSDWALLFNVYFLLGFPLIAVAALAVFRHFRVAWGPSIAGSVLYAFLPSRILKGEGHIFPDAFFEVPLAMLVVLWACGERPPFVRQDRPGLDLRSGRTVAAVLICVLTASTGLYYAFFTGCLLLAGGAWASMARRSWGNVLAALALTVILVAGLGAQGLPTLRYRMQHGPNPQVAVRAAAESELYGLKIAQLLLPVPGHRLRVFRQLSDRYNTAAPLVGENASTSLGVMGSVGFLGLLAVLVLGFDRKRPRDDLWRPLAVLNLAAVLLGTLGGFGSLFALLVTPQIRNYARINVLIGFLALFALVLLLERLAQRHARLGAAALPVVLILGLLDQATPWAVRRYRDVKAEYASDGALVRRIESSVPPGAMIFQLPYLTFPEAGQRPGKLFDYDPLRPYLHSSSLRWSYPTMRGRAGEPWVSAVSQLPSDELLREVSDFGFAGVLVDRIGYPDEGKEIEAALGKRLGAGPMVSNNGRLAFFDLGRSNWRARAEPLPALLLRWGTGFHSEEKDARNTFRWSGARSSLLVDNRADSPRTASLRMILVAAQPPTRLIIDGDLLSETVELAAEGMPFLRTITVPPGSHAIRFRCDGRPANAPGDPRILVWRALDFELTTETTNEVTR